VSWIAKSPCFASRISALKAVLTMNDGSTFSSPEGTETLKIDDTILVVSRKGHPFSTWREVPSVPPSGLG
jgi:hypothetical protein